MQTLNIKRLSRIGFITLLCGLLVSLAVLAWLLDGHQQLRHKRQVVNEAFNSMLAFNSDTEHLLTSPRIHENREIWRNRLNQFEDDFEQLRGLFHRQPQVDEIARLWQVVREDIQAIDLQLAQEDFNPAAMQDKSILRRLGESFSSNDSSARYIALKQIADSLNYLIQYQGFMLEEFRTLIRDHSMLEQQRFTTIYSLTLLLPGLIWLVMLAFILLIGHFIGRIERELLDTQSTLRQSLDTLENQRNELDYMAHHDSLTSLANRSMLHERLVAAIQRAHRSNLAVAVLFIDLDRFKHVNDSFGHGTGDDLLREVAERLRVSLREPDTIARLGGDEFVVILEQIDEPLSAARVAGSIIQRLEKPYQLGELELYITTSIGISLFPQDADQAEELLRNADSAMYGAKQEGRNTFNFYTADMTEKAYQRITLETELRHAISRDELQVYYQPQIDARNGILTGMEALVRWNHPRHGLLEPSRFIEQAEESGLIVKIDEWVLQQATRQFADWYARDLKPGTLAVNLSGRQLHQADLFERIVDILKTSDCSQHWLELEVTEGFIMQQPETTIGLLRHLREYGIRLSIDDFGTGYSSLAYLKRLPITKLKIDMSFVLELPFDSESNAIVRTIIGLANSLGLDVIAEGVERQEQCRYLLQQGCEMVQGYYYGKPMPAAAMEHFLQRRDIQSC